MEFYKLSEITYVYTQQIGEGNATHSSTLAWKIPRMEEPGRLQSMWSRRVGHNRATSLSLFTFMHWRRKRQPTPVFLPGESQGRWSLVGCSLWGRTESDTTEATQQQHTQYMLIFIIISSNIMIGCYRMIYLFKINKKGSFFVGYKFKLTGKIEVRKTGAKTDSRNKTLPLATT